MNGPCPDVKNLLVKLTWKNLRITVAKCLLNLLKIPQIKFE